MQQYSIHQLLVLVVLVLLWHKPDLLQAQGLELAVSLVGSFLLAQAFVLMVQFGLIQYGINRAGVMYLSGILCVLGCALVYSAWQQTNYGVINITWIVIYTAFGVMSAAHKYKLSLVVQKVFLYAEYALVALFAAALFGAHIEQSPIAQFEIKYGGIEAAYVWFIAMVVLSCSVVYAGCLELGKQYRKIARRVTKK